MPLHSHSPSHSLTHRPTLSVTLSTLTQTPCHPLYSLTHPLHSHSISTLTLHYFTFISFAKRTEIVSNAHHRALISFSLRNLWKKKKKGESLYAKCKVCFTIWLLRNNGKNQRNFGFNSFFFFFFFLFWFLFWISNRIVKKDRNFIVFWDWIGLWNWITFLGLFIFAEVLILVLCWSKFTLI